MEENNATYVRNDIAELSNGRVDNLAALITVTAEQMDDRLEAERLLDKGAYRTNELIALVFDGATPSIENYLAAKGDSLQAA